MNPLSPLTYYVRHKRSLLLLSSLICLATFGLYVMVAVLDSIPMRARVSDLTCLSRVRPSQGAALEAGAMPQIQTHPDVAQVISDHGLGIYPPTLLGWDNLHFMGVSPEEAQYLMEVCGARVKEGRLFAPRTNEVVLSEEVVRALRLRLGDSIDRSLDKTVYAGIQAPLVLVGILEGDPAARDATHQPSVRVGFISGEYVAGHELYAAQPSGLLVVAQEGRKAGVDAFLESAIASTRVEVETFGQISKSVAQARLGIYLIFGIVNCVVAIVVAVVVGVINQIALAKRLSEFGLLYALGQQKNALIRRLTLEMGIVAGLGWLAGLGVAGLGLAGLKAGPYYNLGMELDLTNLAPLWFVTPIPLVVTAWTFVSVARLFGRFDAVAIVERGQLSGEADSRRSTSASLTVPLSPVTFYRRHRRRGAMLVISTALMILGSAFPVFLFSAPMTAFKPRLAYLQRVSEVWNTEQGVDAGVTAQIKTHPAVKNVIPAIALGMQVTAPPATQVPISLYGVSESDLPMLLDLFGVQVKEGRLPQARSNEMVLSEAVARNRGLHVGDIVGGRANTQGNDGQQLTEDDIPAEMIIVGLLSPGTPWLGLASYDYLAGHVLSAARPPHLLIVPVEGRKVEMDLWLEQNIASTQTDVAVYATKLRDEQASIGMLVVVFGVLQSLVAFVTAVSLAILNYIFFTQRREEFGILHAIGRSRPWLVWRTVKEISAVVGLAWLLGAAVCIVGLIVFQVMAYTPRGLNLEVFSLTPWLFTLPTPLAVVLVGAGTIARALKRLDPVEVIERQ